MRNLLMLCSALCCFCVSQAQKSGEHFLQSPNTAWAFGARFGLNVSSVTGNLPSSYSTDSKSGAYLGFVLEKALSSSWAVQPAFYYSAQGYVENHRNDSVWYGNYTQRRLMGYFNVPVLLQYITPVGVTVQTGPQVGLLFANDYGDVSNGTTLDWVAGVSYVSKVGLGVEASYILGLTGFTTESYNYPYPNYSDYKLKNRVLQAGLVYYFAVAKKRPARL